MGLFYIVIIISRYPLPVLITIIYQKDYFKISIYIEENNK